MFIFFVVVILNIPNYTYPQIPQEGFFLGGDATLLMMNGIGKIEDEDFEVTNDLFTITGTSTGFDIKSDGWSWENKLLYGLKPLIGYRFSPKFAVSASYGYFFMKTGEQSESFTFLYLSSSVKLDIASEIEYSQSVIQLLGYFYPLESSGFFLSAGIEFVYMNAKNEDELTIKQTGYSPTKGKWRAKGDDKTTGFVFGSGIEIPVFSQNISFTATVLYSLSNYSGDELLEVKSAPLEVTDPNMDIELGVGGFNVNVGLRFYLK